MSALQGKSFFSSWSGGKDSCLALYRAIRLGGSPCCLFTMFGEDGVRSKSHGLSGEIIRAQSKALGLSVTIGSATWGKYEDVFLERIAGLKEQGVTDGVFGDIDLEPHREWVEKVCARLAITPHLPLWQCSRRELLQEFIDAGFKAMIIVLDTKRLDESFLGRPLDWETIEALEAAGVDACGEEGEYHTVVYDGPLFQEPLQLAAGEIVRHDAYSFLEVALHNSLSEGAIR